MEYYYLKKGEIIQAGDEADMCNDGWGGPANWQPAKYRIGKPAPDPAFPAHVRYRRAMPNQETPDA